MQHLNDIDPQSDERPTMNTDTAGDTVRGNAGDLNRTADPTHFIVQFDDDPPTVKGVAGLERLITQYAEDHTYGYGNIGASRVWRWVGGGELEELTVECTKPEKFGDDAWARPEWAATGPDGTKHVCVKVPIDGCA